METQQEDNFLTFIAEQYDLRIIRNKVQTYLTKEAISVGPTDSGSNSRMVSYILDNSLVHVFSYREHEAEELTILEVEVLSDDERTTSALVTKLKEVALSQ